MSASQESVCGNDHFSADVQKPSYLCIVQSQGSGAVETKSHAVSGGSAHIHVIEDTSMWVGLACRASSALCMPFLACSALGVYSWGYRRSVSGGASARACTAMRTQGAACRSPASFSSSSGSLFRASGRSTPDLQILSGSRPTCNTAPWSAW